MHSSLGFNYACCMWLGLKQLDVFRRIQPQSLDQPTRLAQQTFDQKLEERQLGRSTTVNDRTPSSLIGLRVMLDTTP